MTANERLLKREVIELKREGIALRRENRALRERLASAKPFTGAAVEFYIAKLIGGQLTKGLTQYDVKGADGTKFEIKFSRLNIPHSRAVSHRWSWSRPLGSSGAKQFHRLILVGQVDPQYRHAYCEPRSSYVIFDVPFRSVKRLMRKDPIIQISTNPSAKQSDPGKELFRRFHVSRQQLRERYKDA